MIRALLRHSPCRIAFLLLCCVVSAAHADTVDTKLSLKFTPSWYQSSDGNHAWDFNLRANTGAHAAWLGYYTEHSGARQGRTGYEYTENFRAGHIVWSAQAASGGFLGGSATLQTSGDALYLIAGFGRTNLRNYYNLNFDPNDAYTIGVGTGLIPNTDLSLYEIRDDRLGTGQRVTHLYAHVNLSDTDRISIDGTYKRGLSDDGIQVHGHGLTLTYTHRHGFLRIAHDPYANFGRATQNRFSVGLTY